MPHDRHDIGVSAPTSPPATGLSDPVLVVRLSIKLNVGLSRHPRRHVVNSITATKTCRRHQIHVMNTAEPPNAPIRAGDLRAESHMLDSAGRSTRMVVRFLLASISGMTSVVVIMHRSTDQLVNQTPNIHHDTRSRIGSCDVVVGA